MYNAVFLVGSPKPKGNSTSESLARDLAEAMERRGVTVTLFHVMQVRRHPQRLIDAIENAELFVLSAPVYVDALPAPVTEVMEAIAADRKGHSDVSPTAFVAMVNCGFPGPEHTEVPLEICRCFAHHARLRWAGGLGLSEGVAINGRPLTAVGGMVYNVRAALDEVAEALTAGWPVPAASAEKFSRPFLPRWLYPMMGAWGWRRQARANGITPRDLHARPFTEKNDSTS